MVDDLLRLLNGVFVCIVVGLLAVFFGFADFVFDVCFLLV